MSESIYDLRVGDRIVVTRDGRDTLMVVSEVYPPMSAGRAVSAGPWVTAHVRPGGWSVDFDATTTHLTWRKVVA